MPKRATAPIQRRMRSRPPRRAEQAAGEGRGDDQRPEDAEGVVQAGREVVAPDAGVGRVVGDAEVRPAVLQPLGMGQRDRPEALDLRATGCRRRSGCAGTRSRRPASAGTNHHPAAAQRLPGRRQHDHGDAQRRRHRQHRRLGPGGQPDGKPRRRQRPADRSDRRSASCRRRGACQASTRIAIAARSRAAAIRSFLAAPARGRRACGTRAGSPRRRPSAARARRAGRCTRRRGTRPPASRS